MKISEYINGEKEKMKNQSWKTRLVYFWDYYKWHTVIGLLALFFLGYTLVTVISAKDAVLSGILIDAMQPVEDPATLQTFYDANGIDSTKQEAVLITGLSLDSRLPTMNQTAYQRIHAGVGAGDTDFLMGYEYAIRLCAYDTSYMFSDLRKVFSTETLAALEEYIYYIDGSLWETLKNSTEEEIPFPDPHKPEQMVDPIPIAVDISGCSEFVNAYYAPDREVYIAVVTNAPHKELTARFIESLFS